jgi:hypothetical protein
MITNFKIFENKRFKVGDTVYANPDLVQNQLMLDKKMIITKIYNNGYYNTNLYLNFPVNGDRLISEDEYEARKYNL